MHARFSDHAGRPSARVGALGYVAFRYTDSVGTRDNFPIAGE